MGKSCQTELKEDTRGGFTAGQYADRATDPLR